MSLLSPDKAKAKAKLIGETFWCVVDHPDTDTNVKRDIVPCTGPNDSHNSIFRSNGDRGQFHLGVLSPENLLGSGLVSGKLLNSPISSHGTNVPFVNMEKFNMQSFFISMQEIPSHFSPS